MVHILNRYNSIDFYQKLKQNEKNYMIRITSSYSFFEKLQGAEFYDQILEIKFDDVNIERDGSFHFRHREQIDDFFSNHINFDHLIIHCDAGISRSSAVAVAYFMKIKNKKEIKKIFSHPQYFPNQLIVFQFADLYQFDQKYLKNLYNKMIHRFY
ncbi:MAG: hypothetical protein MJB14_12110 [Spirochaetes bacterium]|nr:hypothetical protein [Spirochaetota bacterium]